MTEQEIPSAEMGLYLMGAVAQLVVEAGGELVLDTSSMGGRYVSLRGYNLPDGRIAFRCEELSPADGADPETAPPGVFWR